jgi:hypothetical protein
MIELSPFQLFTKILNKEVRKLVILFILLISFIQIQAQSINVIRGPYIQMANAGGITLRWRTSIATDTKIAVGTTFGTYNLIAINNEFSTEHTVTITGLSADTKYYYQFGSSTSIEPTSATHYFVTTPPKNTNRKVKVAVLGDCGRDVNGKQLATLNAYQNYVGDNPAELLLLLGDNAYNNGLDEEYQAKFFNVYSNNILKNHALFPAPGNHDYTNISARQIDKKIPYYDIFNLPTNAECGGIPSGTESYYSYNWGNMHFISLDSYGKESGTLRLYDTASPQVLWLKQDLAANDQTWTIVYWHHPPFTMGSHNSDTEAELVAIRQNLLQILERNGVDMVLCGHSHTYERSFLLNGYNGNESSFSTLLHTKNSSSGKYDGTDNSCLYSLTSAKENHGTVYVVSGSAGATDGIQANFPHNAMPFSYNEAGMFYFEVEGNRLDASFVGYDGTIRDRFTMMKDVAKTENVISATGLPITLQASWKGNYNWQDGSTGQHITVAPTINTTYTCVDNAGCITDKYTVVVNRTGLPVQLLSFSGEIKGNYPYIRWKFQEDQIAIKYSLEKSVDGIHFTVIHMQQSVGVLVGEYSFVDTEARIGLVYYRLSYIHQGEQQYSNIIKLNYTSNGNKTLRLYPNPAKNELIIENLEQNSIVQLINQNGLVLKTVYSKSEQLIFTISWLRAGNYFIKNIKDNQFKTISFYKD